VAVGMTKIKVLCVTDYYLPGYKGGGPIRTIANMANVVAGKVDFSIITRDRDLGDEQRFPGIQADEWQAVEGARVYYAKSYGPLAIERNLEGQDVLYLNSFFSPRGSIAPLWKFRKRLTILLAPRGEFSMGALAATAPKKRASIKKRAYITLAKVLGLYRHVQWHASTEDEAADIERVFPSARIHIAPDPVVLGTIPAQPAAKQSGELSIAFISRISPKKNLDYLLSVLARVKGSVRLNVYGPTEDTAYWERCMGLARQLPAGIDMQYCGELKAEEVSDTFARHDLFAFPTHGENFGHVIFEALCAGTPVLLSDQTPWKPNSTDALATVPLESSESWVAALQEALDRGSAQQETARLAAREYARNYVAKSDTEGQNIRMFERVAAKLAV
jgi:glycosyltransferase involved in cell wall biosynthesis